jgi:hypothetical protein
MAKETEDMEDVEGVATYVVLDDDDTFGGVEGAYILSVPADVEFEDISDLEGVDGVTWLPLEDVVAAALWAFEHGFKVPSA